MNPESFLFSDRSLPTMVHGIVFGGGSLLTLAAALFFIWSTRERAAAGAVTPGEARAFAHLNTLNAVLIWVAVVAGTYLVFPLYRAPPPEGVTDLSLYPRALIHANPGTVWLHSFGMEIKEHVPWMAAMLATAVAFVSRSRGSLNDPAIRRTSAILLTVCFGAVAAAALLGVFANKVAPVQ
jgi:hypothetical protein